MKQIKIEKTIISPMSPVYFIAEIGSNFDNSFDRAFELIELAKNAGADAAKFQHYTANSLVSDIGFKSLSSSKSHQSEWKKSVYETYEDATLNKEWTLKLKNKCDELGLAFMTSPYSISLVDYVDEYLSAYKIGSGDITWIEIIEHISKKLKPTILATGASSIQDVKRAVNHFFKFNKDLILMQCNTNYTLDKSNFSYINLNVLKEYKKLFPNVILGLSDHTQGHSTVLGAVTLGARVIEKHFTDDTSRSGPDHPFSLDPVTWKNMVEATRELECALGTTEKKIEKNEMETVIVQRRCLRVKEDLTEGKVIAADDLVPLRPCPVNSIAPFEIDKIIGKKINKILKKGDHITWKDIKIDN